MTILDINIIRIIIGIVFLFIVFTFITAYLYDKNTINREFKEKESKQRD